MNEALKTLEQIIEEKRRVVIDDCADVPPELVERIKEQWEQAWIDFTLALLIAIKRRETLSSNVPKCPNCNESQIQLTNIHTVPAQWCCRICKHRFEFEPPAP
jgi:hypothetical protein